MNLTWHIVKKDLRALRWPLVVWSLLIAAKLVVGVMLLSATATLNTDWLTVWFSRLDLLARVLAALENVSFVLVAALIHEDLLVGTTAFWMTRPISGARLLRAKLLAILLGFILLPILVTLPWWLACGYGPREIAWAALETAAIHALCALAGLLWAVVTDGFARFLLWSLVTLVSFPLIYGIIGYQLSKWHPSVGQDLLLSRHALALGLAVVSVLLVTCHQFLTRRTVRSVVMLLSAAVLIVAVETFWPFDLGVRTRWSELTQSSRGVAVEGPVPAGLEFSTEAPRLGGPSGRNNQIRQDFVVHGVPAGHTVGSSSGRFRLTWADGSSEDGWLYQRTVGNRLPAMVGAGLNPGGSTATESPAESCLAWAWLSPAMARRLQSEPAHLTQSARMMLVTVDRVERLPTEAGSRRRDDATTDRVAHVEHETPGLLVSYIRSAADAPASWWRGLNYDFRAAPNFFLLRDPETNRIDDGERIFHANSRIATVQIMLTAFHYGIGVREPGNRAKLADDWTRRAELLRVNVRSSPVFERQIYDGPFPPPPVN